MINRILIGTLIGGFISMMVGWVVFGMLLMSSIQQHSFVYEGLMKPEPNMMFLIVSNLFWSLAMQFIFVKWAKVYSFKKGMIVSIMVCLPISIAMDLQYMSFMNLYKDHMVLILDALGTTVMAGIVGGLMGWIYGKMGVLPE